MSRTAQDDLLIVTALVKYGWTIAAEDHQRADRALELAMDIAEGHGLCLNDAMMQLE